MENSILNSSGSDYSDITTKNHYIQVINLLYKATSDGISQCDG
jgi:hypothetical protein